jgi:hypothetical protein
VPIAEITSVAISNAAWPRVSLNIDLAGKYSEETKQHATVRSMSFVGIARKRFELPCIEMRMVRTDPHWLARITCYAMPGAANAGEGMSIVGSRYAQLLGSRKRQQSTEILGKMRNIAFATTNRATAGGE